MKIYERPPRGLSICERDMQRELVDRIRSREEVVLINNLSWGEEDAASEILSREALESRRDWFLGALDFLSLTPDAANAGGNPLLAWESRDVERCDGTKHWLQSPLVEIPTFQRMATRIWAGQIPGRWFAKMDAALPIAGSVKARGGIYEVVSFAMEMLAKEGIHPTDAPHDVSRIRDVLSRYTVTVASTGNLGLSIGLTARKLGFRAKVYLSSDARAWKIDKLREVGAEVVLMECDYNAVVAMARQESTCDQSVYFVDDERSERLFEGYALAALELREQLEAQLGYDVLMASPLFLYMPCGVGGAPAGIAAGLKAVFGEQVHIFVAEPLEAPSVLLELARRGGEIIDAGDVRECSQAPELNCIDGGDVRVTAGGSCSGRGEGAHGVEQALPCVDVRAFGLSGQTVADGLAVPVASPKAMDVLGATLAGAYTLSDEKMLAYVKLLHEMENLRVEPSAAAALQGPGLMYYTKDGFDYVLGCGLMPYMDQSIHISWMTGGGLMPDEVFDSYYKEGEEKATALVDFLSSF